MILRLYRAAAIAIKKEFPEIKIGGPSLGASGHFVDDEFRPTPFLKNFLAMCRVEKIPLNFFSWHCYTDDPSELTARARAIRRLLNTEGFTQTESHLNEWNYLPANSWEPISRSAAPAARQRAYETMAGAPGGAFVAASLLELQDAPVDVCNFFHGELGPFGIFNEHGVPTKIYHAFNAFSQLLETPRRVEVRGTIPGKLACAAGLTPDNREATILISNFADPRQNIRLNWKNFTNPAGLTADIRTVDATHALDNLQTISFPPGQTSLSLTLKFPALALIRLQPSAIPEGNSTPSEK